MTKLIKTTALTAAAAAGLFAGAAPVLAAPAFDAQSHASIATGSESWEHSRNYRHSHRRYRDEPVYGNTRVWQGQDGRYYCRRKNGTTGLIIGGVAGGVAGNVIDGGSNRTLGTLLGAGAGALLGREIDRGGSNRRCR